MKNKLFLFVVFMLANMGCIAQNRLEKGNGPLKWYEVRQDGRIGIEDANGTVIVPITDFNDSVYFLGARTVVGTAEAHPVFAGEINVEGNKYYAVYDISGSTTYRFTSLGLGEAPQPTFTTDKKKIKSEIKNLTTNIKQNSTSNDLYSRGWWYFFEKDYSSAFKDFANASCKEECSAFMAYMCVVMMDLCEFSLNLKAEGKKQLWSSLLGIVPDITAGITSVKSLFAPVSAATSAVIADDSDGGSSRHKEKEWTECDGCKGTKLCKSCDGTGKSLAKDGKCHACHSKGICSTCKGRGGFYIKVNN